MSCLKRPVEARFLEKVRKGPDCWEWLGTLQSAGYGLLFIKRGPPRIVHLAHRVSWEIHNGSIPDNLQVLHRCDRPSCVNPAHLFLGTAKDNMQDCARKGRIGGQKQLPYIKGSSG